MLLCIEAIKGIKVFRVNKAQPMEPKVTKVFTATKVFRGIRAKENKVFRVKMEQRLIAAIKVFRGPKATKVLKVTGIKVFRAWTVLLCIEAIKVIREMMVKENKVFRVRMALR